MRMTRPLATLLFVTLSLAAHGKPRDAGTWVSLQLAPALIGELTSHPRFKGEQIRLVVFSDDQPAALSNEFELSLRDRLSAAVFDAPGIRLAAQQEPGEYLDCTRDDADYYIGMQLTLLDNNKAQINLRTLDLSDYSWVTGLDFTWKGDLSSGQMQLLETPEADPFFRGQRSTPYAESQADMLAAQLARDLACKSMRQTAGEFVVLVADHGNDLLPGMTAMVGSNLTSFTGLRLTDDPRLANAELRGESHDVGGGLQQYWSTLAPIHPNSALPTLNSSAYIQLSTTPGNYFDIPRSDRSLVGSATLVELAATGRCASPGRGCVGMQVRAERDAVVFFLNHQKNHGLVRLSRHQCSQRSGAQVARANESLQMPLPVNALSPEVVTEVQDWSRVPEGDTFYALAVGNSEAAHVLSRHLQKLPLRCTPAVRFGLRCLCPSACATCASRSPHLQGCIPIFASTSISMTGAST